MIPGASAFPELGSVPHLRSYSDLVEPAPRSKPAILASTPSATSIQALPLVGVRVAIPIPSRT
jgi:hypothetical protein